MLFWLLHGLKPDFHILRVFDYLSFRSIVSALTALFIPLFFSPWMIRYLQSTQVKQIVRQEGPESHLKKSGTPTMGGILIVLSMFTSVLLWGDLSNSYLWVLLIVTLGFAWIGWYDDYSKVFSNGNKGISAKFKFFLQSLIALTAVCFLYSTAKLPVQTSLTIPFLKNCLLPLGWGYILLSYFVIVGTSNAVNLTDGLDGLALLPVVLVALALGIFSYLTGHRFLSEYLAIPYLPHVGEVVVFCSTLIGAGLGFLWYNAYPAQMFMGDVGSLSLGAALGLIAVIIRQELVFFFMSGIFVVETFSVILQVVFYKLTKRRVFRMSPLHHHFELCGWSEPKIIVRFWIITVVLVLLGLATLKLR